MSVTIQKDRDHPEQTDFIHHIHKWPPCNFENLKMSATKERIE